MMDPDSPFVDESFSKTIVPKSESSQALILEALQNSTLFKDLEHELQVDVMLAMDRMTVVAGQDLIRQGEPGNAFYVIEQGEFDIVIDSNRVTTFRRGGSFGEIALIREQPRAATVTALTNAVCWRLERHLFRKYIASTTASTIDQIVKDFGHAELLKNLPLPHLTKLATHTTTEYFDTGTRIIAKGEFGDKFYVIRQGRVRCSNISSPCLLGATGWRRVACKPRYVDLDSGEHFGERALIRDEMRACDVIALEPTSCHVFSREDFGSMLGSLREPMERSFALKVIMSITCVSNDFGTIHVLREQDIFEKLDRKLYKAGRVITPSINSLNKVVVVSSGTVEVRIKGGLGKLVSVIPGGRCILRNGDYLGWQSLGTAPLFESLRSPHHAQKTLWRAYAHTDAICYELDAKIVLRKRHSFLKAHHTSSSQDCAAHKEIPKFEDLDVRRTLGTGAFGRVKLCAWSSRAGKAEVFALKMLVKKTMLDMKQTHAVLYERKILQQLRHPFVLRLHTTYQSRDACYFLLELIQGGELFSRLTSFSDGDFPPEESKFHASATILALEYIHSKNMVYRDLKPENLLIDTDGYVRLVDFGFAKRLENLQPTFTIIGTPEYLSPECALGQGYRFDVDLWAFGVLIFEMMKGNGPFCPADPDDTMTIFKLISDCRVEFSRKEVAQFGEAATSMCRQLLNRSRKKRLGSLKGGVSNIKGHSYFNGIDWNAILDRRHPVPWVPEVSDPFDTSCFDEYDESMEIPPFLGDQAAFKDFSNREPVDDAHLIAQAKAVMAS